MMTEKEISAINDELIECLKALPLYDCDEDQEIESMREEFEAASEFYAEKLRAVGSNPVDLFVAALYMSKGRSATPETIAHGLATALTDLAQTQDERFRLLSAAESMKAEEFASMAESVADLRAKAA